MAVGHHGPLAWRAFWGVHIWVAGPMLAGGYQLNSHPSWAQPLAWSGATMGQDAISARLRQTALLAGLLSHVSIGAHLVCS